MTLLEWHDQHAGEDIYVLGSGATLDYIDPGFFRDRTVVATNRVAERLDLYRWFNADNLYTHTHYHAEDAVPLARAFPEHTFFAPLGEQGHAGLPAEADRLRNIVFYPHQPTVYDFHPDRAWPPEGGLMVGSTSLHGSMHLAAHMGAATIILVGADCGILDGATNQAGYQSGNLKTGDQLAWLARWEQHLRLVKQKLIDVYGVRIYSLNPFLNPNLEGHVWEGSR